MFSMFPDGWPGAGLLLLRVAGGAVLILEGIAYSVKRELGFLGWMALGVVGAVGVLLLIGFLTRYVALGAAVVAAGAGLSWFSSVHQVAPTTAALSAVIAVAVICLGPGVWSLDARLFGRREIVIPPSSSKT